MTDTTAMTETSAIHGWHAHVYYTPETRGVAERLREGIAARWPAAVLGRWHDKLVGPHAQSMYQVAFDPGLFAELVSFIALNRGGLTVLVHPESGQQKPDHLERAFWFGAPLPLDASVLAD